MVTRIQKLWNYYPLSEKRASRFDIMQSIRKLLFTIILIPTTVIAQETNSITEFPYGCEKNEPIAASIFWPQDIPRERLDCDVEYLNYGLATFQHRPYFRRTRFFSSRVAVSEDSESVPIPPTSFFATQFDEGGDFNGSIFETFTIFTSARFKGTADFNSTSFARISNFNVAKFELRAIFANTIISGPLYFRRTLFYDQASFNGSLFEEKLVFQNAIFIGPSYFRDVRISDEIDFSGASFFGPIDFGVSDIGESQGGIVRFYNATLRDTLSIGKTYSSYTIKDSIARDSLTYRTFDLRRAHLLESGRTTLRIDTLLYDLYDNSSPSEVGPLIFPGAIIEIHSPVLLQLEIEKFKFIQLEETLSYFQKKDIISTLIQESFNSPEQARERFELEFIFSKSTMYQERSEYGTSAQGYRKLGLGRQALNSVYYVTMGLGYRPFWLLFWGLGIIAGFALVYLVKIPTEINRYLDVKNSNSLRKEWRIISDAISCSYFSAMVFFTLRLKRNILAEFGSREKTYIVLQWCLGFAAYASFVFLSKSGSILHSIRSLFVG